MMTLRAMSWMRPPPLAEFFGYNILCLALTHIKMHKSCKINQI